MRNSIIDSIFSVDQRVRIIAGDYNGKEGTVVRLGTAASVIYVHVLVDGMLTILTFLERDLE